MCSRRGVEHAIIAMRNHTKGAIIIIIINIIIIV